MKFLISNLRLLARKFSSVAIINVVGLAVAFAVTLVVAKQVWWDATYDRGFDNAGSIHMVETDWGMGGGPRTGMNQQIPELWAERLPELDDYCLISSRWGKTLFRRADSDGEGAQAVFHFASKGFLTVFTPEIVAGDASETLLAAGRCLVDQSTARAIFGTDDPIGRTITGLGGNVGDLVVDAVYRDFPANSSISGGIYTMLAPEPNSGFWNSMGYFLFPHADLARVTERANDPTLLTESKDGNNNYEQYTFHFTELGDIYMHGGATGQGGHFGNIIYLLVVGLFVLIVATINFVNLSMAMAPARVRGVNVHRILGIGRGAMRISLAMECVLTAAIAVAVGGGLVHWFAGSTFTGFFSAPLDLTTYVGLTAATMVLFLVVAFAVGLYSARYASSFEMAIALKSSFALSPRGTRLRNTLIVVQFATAIFFICFASAIIMQYRFMSNYSVGYERENIVAFDGGPRKVLAETLCNELRRNPNIVDITSSYDMPGRIGSFSGTDMAGKPVSYVTWTIAENFLDFFGIAATPGRIDNKLDMKLHTLDGSFTATLTVNREFMRRFDFTEDELDGMGVGISEDINFASLHEPIKPLGFMMAPEWKHVYSKIFVKITGKDVAATIKHIEDTWKSLSGSPGVNITFLDEEIDSLYRRESNMARLVGILGLVTVLVAIMGVYGLAMFNTRYKTREIAIRKVNGARRSEVVSMLNRGMVIQVSVAFVLTVPVAVWMVGRWLGAFAFRADVPWMLYPSAGIAVMLIAVATVSWQSWRAASANPVKVLMSE